MGYENGPIFSPDRSMIAFTGEYDGNQDVYVVPASGGMPRRLTFHPGPAEAVSWSPDGKQVIFRSMFRKTGIGPLIGKTTWGGLVGHYTNPGDLLDGGFAGTPNLAFYTTDGKWEVENHGVPPSIEVEMDRS